MAPENDDSLETFAPDLTPSDRPTLKQEMASGSKAARKVDLDLDDAPFLVEEEEPEPEPAQSQAAPDAPKLPTLEAPPSKKFNFRDKRIIMAAVGLVVAAALIPVLLRSKSAPKPPEPAKPLVEIKPEQPKTPPKPETVPLLIEPFLVEHLGKDGVMRFLTFRYTTSTESQELAKEFQRKTVILRDASYYYLRNKSIEFLTDPANLDLLKRDLLTVMNQYLASGQLDAILIEEYLIK